jgi:hypothetical protein
LNDFNETINEGAIASILVSMPMGVRKRPPHIEKVIFEGQLVLVASPEL